MTKPRPRDGTAWQCQAVSEDGVPLFLVLNPLVYATIIGGTVPYFWPYFVGMIFPEI